MSERRSLADVFKILQQMPGEGIIADYALGGATAVLFYAEPTRTYDLDVFVSLPDDKPANSLEPLSRIYEWARARGFVAEAEHIFIYEVPVQFLPAFNVLSAEAITHARALSYEDVPVRVVDPEHLVALALQAGGTRRRERAWQLLESGSVDRGRLRELLRRHKIEAEIPEDV